MTQILTNANPSFLLGVDKAIYPDIALNATVASDEVLTHTGAFTNQGVITTFGAEYSIDPNGPRLPSGQFVYGIGTSISSSPLITFDGTTIVFTDGAMVWNDWNFSSSAARVPVVGGPDFNTFVGNTEQPQFKINDALQFGAQEMLHDWAEGTPLHIHCHWATGGTNDATPRGVKWEAEITVANTDFNGVALYQFPSTTVISAESTIPALAPDRSSFGTSIGIMTMANLKIGSQMVIRLRRIAASGTAPVDNPFLLSFGIHYQKDTLGSRSIAAK